VKISCGGSLLKKVCSRSSSSAPWLVLKVVASLGRVCDGLGHLQGLPFLRV
jgi:hypothetical protein